MVLALGGSGAAQSASYRSVLSADADWRFFLGDPAGAESSSFADAAWRVVSVPHDWSIEGKPLESNATGSGGGYFPSGIAWYRKSFTAPAAWQGKQVSLEFDGVSMNATVYLNGKKLGFHPYAYTSFRYDITSQINRAGKNVIAVRVDTSSQPSSRWYSGAGIYRHVRVIVTNPVHIAPWGLFVSTPEATANSATVRVKTEVRNDTADHRAINVKTILVGPSGKPVGHSEEALQIGANQENESAQEINVNDPSLWSPSNPKLYRAVTQVIENGKVIDQVEMPFGVRTLSWSVEKGLLLNGEPIKLAGGSVHHDNGPLGAAAFDRAEERRVELLKAAGFNAVRAAHNPPSAAFLDACDRLGLLVLDEPLDVWTVAKRTYDYAQYFHDWWRTDVDAMVKRDRNHPSVIMWGIGNEIPEVWTPAGAPLSKEVSEYVRSLDSTRPLTQAFPGATFGPNPDAAIAYVDIAGYNYNLAQNRIEDHRRVPGRIMMTTESLPADAFEQWALAHDNPYVVGEFVWTAMDYLGESGIGAWSYGDPKQAAMVKQMKGFLRAYFASMGKDGKNPMAPYLNGQPPSPIAPAFPWHAAYCGDLDLTGFRKPWSYYRDILWNGGDRLYTTVLLPEPESKKILAPGWAVYPSLPSWTWAGQEGRMLTVEVYSRVERVRLFLNDKLIGEKAIGRDQEFKADFEVPYAPGILKTQAVRGDHVVAEAILVTAGKPIRLKLTPDRKLMAADGEDLVFVTVEAVDEDDRLVQDAAQTVHFEVTGTGSVAAVGNGDEQSLRSYMGDAFELFHGRAIVVLRSGRKPGKIVLSAKADGLEPAHFVVPVKAVHISSEIK
jgi:beta-galactosidase